MASVGVSTEQALLNNYKVMNYSVTMLGILVAVGVPILAKIGFSDECSNQLINVVVNYLTPLVGAVIAWVGRVNAGGVTMAGFKVK